MTEKEKQARRKQALEQLETLFDDRFALYARDVVRNFEGQFSVLESAFGALIMGRLLGWRVLSLIHSRNTMLKYQKVLGLDFKGKLPWDKAQDVMPEVGPFAEMSNAYNISERIGEWWKIIKGEEKIERSEKEKLEIAL